MAKIEDEAGSVIEDESGAPIYDEGPAAMAKTTTGAVEPTGAPVRRLMLGRIATGDI
jgi:hypothetical protein